MIYNAHTGQQSRLNKLLYSELVYKQVTSQWEKIDYNSIQSQFIW